MAELTDPDKPTRDQEIALAQLTMQMRTYDVLVALLNHFDSDEADKVYDAHAAGKVFTPDIWLAEVPTDV